MTVMPGFVDLQKQKKLQTSRFHNLLNFQRHLT